MSESKRGVWVAYNYDGSGFAVFETELHALRYALAYGAMPVIFMRYGESISDAEQRQREERA